ncbi:MAG: hypothetical protein ACTH5L_02960 [Halomonas sp.]|uniref:hypothetical protein n=1 Tax=Halomonas TaxID=2745 RepID=UPI000EE4C59F|nr:MULTISPECIES: hypothetical protein [Halomonas]HCR96983.1 hypothetical protein [Halomonas sp.]
MALKGDSRTGGDEPSVVDMSDNGKVDPCASDNELGYLDDHPSIAGALTVTAALLEWVNT